MNLRFPLLFGFVALASLVACTNSSKTCTLVDCFNNISLKRSVAISSADVPKHTLTVCRNGRCSSGKLPADVDSSCELKGDLGLLSCSLDQGAYAVSLGVRFEVDDPKSGDDVTVKLVNDDTGAAPIDVQTKVTYKSSQPNGPDCDPVCMSAEL